MDNLDIPALVERIREHRFNGYTDNMLADEVERFRAGPGTDGIGAAVEALKAVATSLSETDDTLRDELGRLGVEWQSEAGAQAGSAMNEHARFSRDANDKVLNAAQLIFAQGEAFNRTLHKLPDAQTLRAGAGGYNAADSVLSLLGFETDHSRKVAAAREARQQALEALNAYARDSGDNLSGTEELAPPQALRAAAAPRLPGTVDAGGGPGDVTTAAGATAGQPAPAPAAAPSGPFPGGAPAHNAPTPALGLPAQHAPARGTGSGTPAPGAPAPERTAPSGVPTAPAAAAGGVAGAVGALGAAGARGVPRSGGRPETAGGGQQPGTTPPGSPAQGSGGATGAAPGATARPGPGGTPGAGLPGKVAGPGSTGAPVPGTPGGTAVPPASGLVGKVGTPSPGTPGGNANEPPLGKGKSFGSAPQPQTPGSGTGSGGYPAAPRTGMSANDFGAGAAALGAGGVAGALSGEGERRGRGVGRSAPGAARSPHQLPIGDLPEEEARAQRNSDRLAPRENSRQNGLLERAADRDEQDGDHVRRYGVDDSDLFTDQRMVSPDVIGDERPEGRR
ncbi:magnesium chelatase [Qaidamihabitans albus]|uniref:magnesium chelatase n=1 Tax=Qaidamihabitans albus TaxID=2795733 RepID=UPI0018F1FADE|nr:magnesium chelatase [Qaidamihabitans albus]